MSVVGSPLGTLGVLLEPWGSSWEPIQGALESCQSMILTAGSLFGTQEVLLEPIQNARESYQSPIAVLGSPFGTQRVLLEPILCA
jgi:hypothetical protein